MYKARYFLRMIAGILFSPGLAVGIGISVIGIFISLSDTEENIFIHHLFLNRQYYLIATFVYMSITFVFEGLINHQKEKIYKLEAIIEEKNRQLAQTHQIVYNRYGEFANFCSGLRFEECLKKFVDKNIIVDSAQIYRVKRNKENRRIVITLNHEKGYCKANFDINSMLQTRYILNYDIYIRFRREVWRRWRRLHNENLKSWEVAELYNNISISARNLVDDICKRLNSIDIVGNIEENDFSYYRLLSVLVLVLLGRDGTIEFDNDIDDDDVSRYLRRGKRTGVLGAILLEDVFIFTHKGQSKKNGRIYVSFYFEEFSVPYVVIFSVTPKNLSERTNFEYEVETLVNDFKKILFGGSNNE